jgi:NAD(P)-dependent dehydrogenase (short-subunit alcohol dehydrogenase family)
MTATWSFEGRTAVVTGAGGGSGLALASALSAAGAAVVGVDLKPRPDSLPAACGYVEADVTEPGLADSVVARVVRDHGGLDFLVNGAGVAWFERDTSIVDLPETIWDRVLAINLTAAMRFARAAVPELRRRGGGAIVHIASVAGLRGMDDPMDAYQVSKAGLISLSRALAVRYAPEGIRSNTVCPGAIDTPMVADIYADDPERRARMAARTPVRRLGQAEDVVGGCLYLLSDEAGFVTGIDLVVDGGWLAVMP